MWLLRATKEDHREPKTFPFYQVFRVLQGCHRPKAFTMVEALVAASLMTIIFMAGSMLFVAGQRLWSMVDGQIRLQENARLAMQRVSFELQEAGRDRNDILQVWVSNNTGVGGSDILRFSIPLCLCGRSVMDEDGEVQDWGAPLSWSATGCIEDYPILQNGKVLICHLPPGNPGNAHDLEVAPAAVKAHLAHGDWLGACDACNPSIYPNKYIEYRLNNSQQLIRRVLNPALGEINRVVICQQITDFQVMQAAANAVTLQGSFRGQVYPMRTINLSRTETILLRNYE